MIQRVWTVALLALALAACGGESDGDGTGGTGGTGGAGGTGGGDVVEAPTCDEGFTPCGGDPVGTWRFDQACGAAGFVFDLTETDPACQDILGRAVWDRLDGTVTFRSGGTYELDAAVEQTRVFDVPAACLLALAPQATPEDVCPALGSQFTENEEISGGCLWRTDECHCTLEILGHEQSTGTWSTDGGTLSGWGSLDSEYCVEDGYLVRRMDDGLYTLVQVLARVP